MDEDSNGGEDDDKCAWRQRIKNDIMMNRRQITVEKKKTDGKQGKNSDERQKLIPSSSVTPPTGTISFANTLVLLASAAFLCDEREN